MVMTRKQRRKRKKRVHGYFYSSKVRPGPARALPSWGPPQESKPAPRSRRRSAPKDGGWFGGARGYG